MGGLDVAGAHGVGKTLRHHQLSDLVLHVARVAGHRLDEQDHRNTGVGASGVGDGDPIPRPTGPDAGRHWPTHCRSVRFSDIAYGSPSSSSRTRPSTANAMTVAAAACVEGRASACSDHGGCFHT